MCFDDFCAEIIIVFQFEFEERVIYLKRKPNNVSFERSFETGRISVMKGSRRVLVKVVLFQLRGPGHPQDDANTNFFADSKRPI